MPRSGDRGVEPRQRHAGARTPPLTQRWCQAQSSKRYTVPPRAIGGEACAAAVARSCRPQLMTIRCRCAFTVTSRAVSVVWRGVMRAVLDRQAGVVGGPHELFDPALAASSDAPIINPEETAQAWRLVPSST